MTEEEKEILELLNKAWGKFITLPGRRQDGAMNNDVAEFLTLIHHCQSLIAARVGFRISEKERKA